MSDNPFDAGPVNTSSAKPADFDGKLILVYAREYLHGENAIKTADYGEKDVVVADVHDVEAGVVERGVYFFQGRLIGDLKRRIGKKPRLARLGRSDAKVKGNRAWEFKDVSSADEKKALEYIRTLQSDENPFD